MHFMDRGKPTHSNINTLNPRKILGDPFGYENHNKVQLGASLYYGNSSISSANLENGFGLGVKIAYNWLKEESNFSIYTGLTLDYMNFGGKRIKPQNNTSISVETSSFGVYPYLDVEIGHKESVILFGSTFIGIRTFGTDQVIEYSSATGGASTRNSNSLKDTETLIYGVGGGLKINLSNPLKLEIRYQKNFGGARNIVDPNSILFDSSGKLVSYKTSNIDTDLDIISLGLLIVI